MRISFENKKARIGYIALLSVGLLLVLTAQWSKIHELLAVIGDILTPIFLGLFLAYLLNPIFRFFEKTVFKRMTLVGLRRVLSLVLTFLILFLALGVLFGLIVPSLFKTVLELVSTYNERVVLSTNYVNALIARVNSFINGDDLSSPLQYLSADAILRYFAEVVESLVPTDGDMMAVLKSDLLTGIVAALGGIVSFSVDFLFAIFIAIYLLASKEKRYAQIMRARRAFFSDDANAKITRIVELTENNFSRYLRVKIVDAIVVGIVLFAGYYGLGIPHPLLFTVFLTASLFIPLIGPLLGVLTAGFVCLYVFPFSVSTVVAIAVGVLLVNSYLVMPRFLKDANGINALFIIVSVTFFSAIFGVVGFVLGVPLAVTVADFLLEWFNSRLSRAGHDELHIPTFGERQAKKKSEHERTTSESQAKKREDDLKEQAEINDYFTQLIDSHGKETPIEVQQSDDEQYEKRLLRRTKENHGNV